MRGVVVKVSSQETSLATYPGAMKLCSGCSDDFCEMVELQALDLSSKRLDCQYPEG